MSACGENYEVKTIAFRDFEVHLKHFPNENRGGRGGGSGDSGPQESKRGICNVGLVVWQSGVVLADYLLCNPPYGDWSGVRVVDLGCGTGIVGICMALAGASVVLSDLPHITALAKENLDRNCLSAHRDVRVVDYEWGEDIGDMGAQPDVLVAADVLYRPPMHESLLKAICLLAAPHTYVFIAYRKRDEHETSFFPKLESAGFVTAHVALKKLQADFQSGEYQIAVAVRV